MYHAIEKLFQIDTKALHAKLVELASSLELPMPQKVNEVFQYIDQVKSYQTPENFTKNAPYELIETSKLETAATLLSAWQMILRNSGELENMHRFIQNIALPRDDAKLRLYVQNFSQTLTAALFAQPHRFEEIADRFEILLGNYVLEYKAFHQFYHAKLEKLAPQIEDMFDKIHILRKLHQIPALSAHYTLDEIDELSINAEMFMACSCLPLDSEIRESYVCPHCFITFDNAQIFTLFEQARTLVDKTFKQCQYAVSQKLAEKILSSHDDELTALIKAFSVADLSALKNVFSPLLCEKLSHVLS